MLILLRLKTREYVIIMANKYTNYVEPINGMCHWILEIYTSKFAEKNIGLLPVRDGACVLITCSAAINKYASMTIV